jgi:hypothetical protein
MIEDKKLRKSEMSVQAPSYLLIFYLFTPSELLTFLSSIFSYLLIFYLLLSFLTF